MWQGCGTPPLHTSMRFFCPCPKFQRCALAGMVGSGWQKIKPWTVQPKQLYPVMSDIEIWGGASFIIIMLVSSGWNALSIYCRIGFLNSQSVPGTCDKKNCECVVQVAFLELYCLPSCVLQPGHSRNWGVRWQVWSRTAKQYSNQTDLVIYWQFVSSVFSLFNESWHRWLEQFVYYNDKPAYVLFCRVLWFFPWFSHVFP